MNFYLVLVFTLGLTDFLTQAVIFSGDGSPLLPIDNFVQSVDLQYSFNFVGTHYSTLDISDNGVVAFINNHNALNNVDLQSSTQYIAPLGHDFVIQAPGSIRHMRYSGSHSELQTATDIVNQYIGNNNFIPSDLTVVTWDEALDLDNGLNTFQLALTQNSDATQSYVIFLYDRLEVLGQVKVGISLGDNVIDHQILAWDGITQTLACDSSITPPTVQQLLQRSQTACGTRAGVIVFPVHDTASLLSHPVCTFEPSSGCATEPKTRSCKARRKRRAAGDL